MDTVFLHGLSINGKHGVLPRERHVEQEFIIDIDAVFDAKTAAASDSIDDTVDYVRFRDIAVDVITSESHYLIERVATRIIERILTDSRIASVSVRIRKPSVLPNGVPGISITRTRVSE